MFSPAEEKEGRTHVLSTIIESKAIPLAAYSLATSAQVFRKRPSPSYVAPMKQTRISTERNDMYSTPTSGKPLDRPS
jgi:hypothetical protein